MKVGTEMHWDWATFGIGIVTGLLLAVVAWCVLFLVLMRTD